MQDSGVVARAAPGTTLCFVVVLTCIFFLNALPVFAQDAVVLTQRVQWLGGRVCVDVDGALPYVGEHAFMVGVAAAGERYVFADTSAGIARRVAIVQAEHIVGVDVYRYPLTGGITVGAVPFKINTSASSLVLEKMAQPGNEGEVTARFLESRGIHVADQWVKIRYATYDPQGRHELLIFYMEPADREKVDLADVGPSDFPAFSEAFRSLRNHADAALRLNDCHR